MTIESEQQEWTPEYVGSLVGETFNGAWVVAAAHNAELATERERFDTLQRQAGELHSRAHRAEQQLMSAQAAIENHNKQFAGHSLKAIIKSQYKPIDVNLSLLHQHDAEVLEKDRKTRPQPHFNAEVKAYCEKRIAEVRKPLVNALESIAANTCCDKCQEAALVAKDALAKVKEGK